MYPIIGRKFKDRYRVEAPLGRGGMAEVYKVWDEQRSVFLALKLLREDLAQDPVFLRRFQREASSLAKLQHPHIVRFYGLEKDDLQVFLLMDYIEGTTLREQIARAGKGGLPLTRVREVLRDVCAALNYAHNQGLMHCDIKAGNILLEKGGKAYLSDFGIARMSDSATATMVGVGTPAYMAPELIKGREPTPQTDIYALGVVLYEMLTGGERPFTGEGAAVTGTNAEKVRWEQVNLPPVPPTKCNPDIPPELEAVVLRCLHKDLRRRYNTPLALLDAIQVPPAEIFPEMEREVFARKSYNKDEGNVPVPPSPKPAKPNLPVETVHPTEPKVAENDFGPIGPGKSRTNNWTKELWPEAGIFAIFMAIISAIFILVILTANHQEKVQLRATQNTVYEATAVFNSTRTAVYESTAAVQATQTAVYEATATAQTSQVLTEVERLSGGEWITLDPELQNFELTEDNSDNLLECETLASGLKNFVLDASFITPADISNGWDFGVLFRDEDKGNAQYRLVFTGNEWKLENWLGGTNFIKNTSEYSQFLNDEAGKFIRIKLVAMNNDGYLFINEKFAGQLDLNIRQNYGLISFCTDLYNNYGVNGNVIQVLSVRLWELP